MATIAVNEHSYTERDAVPAYTGQACVGVACEVAMLASGIRSPILKAIIPLEADIVCSGNCHPKKHNQLLISAMSCSSQCSIKSIFMRIMIATGLEMRSHLHALVSPFEAWHRH